MFKLTSFLKPYTKECIIGQIAKLFEATLELALPTLMALIINNGILTQNLSYVLKLGGIMLFMSILGFCNSLLCQYYAARASQGFGTDLRNHLFKHLSSLSYQEIDHFGTSSLMNRITSDVNQLQLAVAMFIRLVSRAPFICIGAMIMAMILDFKLSLILIGAIPVFAVILYFILSRASVLYSKYQHQLDRITVVLRENLTGVRVIRAFAKTEQEKKRFTSANEDLTDLAIEVGKVSALLNPLTTFVMNAAIIAILWVGGFRVNSGKLSQGEIIAFVNYITQILLALIIVSNLVVIFTKASASAKRINEALEAESSIIEKQDVDIDERIEPSIEFKNVSFAYSSESELVLTDISVSIRSGETVGIIGGTGSGKSTFLNLIPRFYDVSSGKIFIGGKDIQDFSLRTLRDKIGIVPQNALLFTGTIAENIRWGKENATDEEIVAACKTAQAHEFITKLSDQYNTQVSRGGSNLSGGQKQRLTIARALVGKPEILILDDSSSALDMATDRALRQSIKESSKDMTVLIVSQRASTVKYADKIIVFDNGYIAGIGTHTQLISSCEVYQEIYYSQHPDEKVTK